LVHLKVNPYGGDPRSEATPVSNFFGNIPVDIQAPAYLSPLGYGGYRIEDNSSAVYGVNIIGGHLDNSIAIAGLGANTIAGGGTNAFPHALYATHTDHAQLMTIGGGYDNMMDSAWPSTIAGGAHNRINMATNDAGRTNKYAGYTPDAEAHHNTIGGGSFNAMYESQRCTIAGGSQHSIGLAALGPTGYGITISGGMTNLADGDFSVISGGSGNEIGQGGGISNVICGGTLNTVGNTAATHSGIFGGTGNVVDGSFSYAFGQSCLTTTHYSLAIGRRAKATNRGVFVFVDGTDADFTIATQDMFGARFAGGYYFTGGTFTVDQADNAGAIPAVAIDQADVSEGFINFIGSDRGVIGEGTNSTASVRVEIGGVVHRLALYADA
jgi:hypothetical protein